MKFKRIIIDCNMRVGVVLGFFSWFALSLLFLSLGETFIVFFLITSDIEVESKCDRRLCRLLRSRGSVA